MVYPGLGFKGGVLGFKSEVTWGTPLTPERFVELISGSIEKDIDQLHTGVIPKLYTPDTEMVQGIIKVKGNYEMEVRYEGMELLFLNALGTQTDAEVASFVVVDSGAGQNNMIDFTESAGAAKVATLTAGTYAIGASSAVAGSLCKLIKDQLEAANDTAITYTVTYSSSTKLLTIVASAGTFSFLFNTGTNKTKAPVALLGYAASDLSSTLTTLVSTIPISAVYTHTFTINDALPVGLTTELSEDIDAATMSGGKINSFGISCDNKGFLKCKLAMIGKDKAYAGSATSPTLSTSPLALFHHGVVTYNGGAAVLVENVELTLSNKLKEDRSFLGSQTVYEPMRSGKYEVTGKFTMEFNDNGAYDDFVAATSRALTITFTGPIIKGALTYKIAITCPKVKPTKVMPALKDQGVIKVEVPFKAYATDNSTREVNVVITNTIATY